jgi:hypothetical protein
MAIHLLNENRFDRIANDAIEPAIPQRHSDRPNTLELAPQRLIVIPGNFHHRLQPVFLDLAFPIKEFGGNRSGRLQKASLGAFGDLDPVNHAAGLYVSLTYMTMTPARFLVAK